MIVDVVAADVKDERNSRRSKNSRRISSTGSACLVRRRRTSKARRRPTLRSPMCSAPSASHSSAPSLGRGWSAAISEKRAAIERVRRGRTELAVAPDLALQRGDLVAIEGYRSAIVKAAPRIGDEVRPPAGCRDAGCERRRPKPCPRARLHRALRARQYPFDHTRTGIVAVS